LRNSNLDESETEQVSSSTAPGRTIAIAVALVVGLVVMVALYIVDRADGGGNLSVFDALVLGIVEGLTEYLPVSSTGHLLVTNEILGLNETEDLKQAASAFAICIQAGAIFAVTTLYRERVVQMIQGLLGKNQEGLNVLKALVIAFVVTALPAFFIGDVVEKYLFSMLSIACAWLVGGIVILLLDRQKWFDRAGGELTGLTNRQAALIGLIQLIALWPGVSRSLVVIMGGLLVGLSLRAAVEFSFLLGLVTLTAATALVAMRDGSLIIESFGVTRPLVGAVTAFVAAVVSVRWMVAWLNNRGFSIFG